jgi:hypothetical protein
LSDTFERIKRLIVFVKVRISEHGYDELADGNLTAREVVEGIESAILVEDYPDFTKGPTILLLQSDRNQQPIHVVWGIPKGYNEPAVLVTAYRPDPTRWKPSFTERNDEKT